MNINIITSKEFELYIECPIIQIIGTLKSITRKFKGVIHGNTVKITKDTEPNNEQQNKETFEIKFFPGVLNRLKGGTHLKKILAFAFAGYIFFNPTYANAANSQLLSGVSSDKQVMEILKKAEKNPEKFTKDVNKIVKKFKYQAPKELINLVENHVKIKFYSDNKKLSDEDKIFLQKTVLSVVSKAITNNIYNFLKLKGYIDKNGNINPEIKNSINIYLSTLNIKVYPTHYDKNILPTENQNSGNSYLSFEDRENVTGIGFGGYCETKNAVDYKIFLGVPGADNINFLKKLKDNNVLNTYLAMIYQLSVHEGGHSLKNLENIINNKGVFLDPVPKNKIKNEIFSTNKYVYPENIAIYFQYLSGKKYKNMLTFDKINKIIRIGEESKIFKLDNDYNKKILSKYINAIDDSQKIFLNIMNNKNDYIKNINKSLAKRGYELSSTIKMYIDQTLNSKNGIKDLAQRFYTAEIGGIVSPDRNYLNIYGEYAGILPNEINNSDIIKNILDNKNTAFTGSLNNNVGKKYMNLQSIGFSNYVFPDYLGHQDKKIGDIIYLKNQIHNISNELEKYDGLFGILPIGNNTNYTKMKEADFFEKNSNQILYEVMEKKTTTRNYYAADYVKNLKDNNLDNNQKNYAVHVEKTSKISI